ncbi:energy-coupling factor transporter transmembrane component T [Isoptericola variabilis]|uniref:energy-coupling factor transporter transmembrane component T n=1 Tax=Isoptericola variabilis TaxID=139208 RepID=UPI002BC15164|nr:energy-coupling factor transporter transmembrane component T [Isoptericola sp.]
MTGVLARVNALVLVALGLLGLVASLGVRDVASAAVGLGACLAFGLVLLPRGAGSPARYVAVLVAVASVTWSTWLLGGHDPVVAGVAGVRIAVLALPGVALAPLVDPSGLADQLGQRLRLPARFVVGVGAALQRFERLGTVWEQAARARRSRGVGPGRGPLSRARHAASVTFAVLASTLRDATAMSVAMDARGFAHAYRRTWADPAPWTRTDTAVLAAGALAAALPFAALLG